MRITNLTLLLGFLLLLSLPVYSAVNIETRVSELLSAAMHEVSNNNHPQAELLYLQVKSLHPSIRRPRWLKNVDRKNHQDELHTYLTAIASMPWQQAKPLLDERLAREPSNIILRKKYLDLAEKHKDKRTTQRHKSALNMTNGPFAWIWRITLLLILSLLIIWNLYALYRDYEKTN